MHPDIAIVGIRDNLKYYIADNKIHSLILGVSGGIDSALVAALARPVCDEHKIPLIGRSLPTRTNNDGEMQRAKLVGEAFCHDFDILNFNDIYKDVANAFIEANTGSDERKGKIRHGNIKARLRMIYLYDLAQKNNGMVLGTDNYTEYMVGFWTLHGDVGDYGIIQNYWKTEVYDMSHYLVHREKRGAEALQACIDAIPTDGNGITSSDLEQLGAKTYEEVDRILQDYFDLNYLQQIKGIDRTDTILRIEDRIKELEKHPVIQRHLRTEFKRKNPYNVPR